MTSGACSGGGGGWIRTKSGGGAGAWGGRTYDQIQLLVICAHEKRTSLMITGPGAGGAGGL